MEIHDIMMALAREGISTSMHYDTVKDQCYVDLKTKTKSELYLFEDGTLRGRYDYEHKIDLSQGLGDIKMDLCREFNDSLHGRDYHSDAWAELCRKRGVALDIVIKGHSNKLTSES